MQSRATEGTKLKMAVIGNRVVSGRNRGSRTKREGRRPISIKRLVGRGISGGGGAVVGQHRWWKFGLSVVAEVRVLHIPMVNQLAEVALFVCMSCCALMRLQLVVSCSGLNPFSLPCRRRSFALKWKSCSCWCFWCVCVCVFIVLLLNWRQIKGKSEQEASKHSEKKAAFLAF